MTPFEQQIVALQDYLLKFARLQLRNEPPLQKLFSYGSLRTPLQLSERLPRYVNQQVAGLQLIGFVVRFPDRLPLKMGTPTGFLGAFKR